METKSKNPQSYPCWMYHKEHGARLFDNPIEFDDAGAGWVDNPKRLGDEPETPPDVSALKARAKELKINGYAVMSKPETLIRKIAEAEAALVEDGKTYVGALADLIDHNEEEG